MAGQRLSHLDGLRGAAAFSVFVCHFVQTFLPHIYYLDRSESHGLWEDEFATSPFNIVVNGNFAVCLFFVLSGYVLSCRYLAGGDLESLRRLAVKSIKKINHEWMIKDLEVENLSTHATTILRVREVTAEADATP